MKKLLLLFIPLLIPLPAKAMIFGFTDGNYYDVNGTFKYICFLDDSCLDKDNYVYTRNDIITKDIPTPYYKFADNKPVNTEPAPAVPDFCPNIAGPQSDVPSGYHKDANGCWPDVGSVPVPTPTPLPTPTPVVDTTPPAVLSAYVRNRQLFIWSNEQLDLSKTEFYQNGQKVSFSLSNISIATHNPQESAGTRHYNKGYDHTASMTEPQGKFDIRFYDLAGNQRERKDVITDWVWSDVNDLNFIRTLIPEF